MNQFWNICERKTFQKDQKVNSEMLREKHMFLFKTFQKDQKVNSEVLREKQMFLFVCLFVCLYSRNCQGKTTTKASMAGLYETWANIIQEKLENSLWSKSQRTLQVKIKYLNFNLLIIGNLWNVLGSDITWPGLLFLNHYLICLHWHAI